MEKEKYVDESWKDSIAQEKEGLLTEPVGEQVTESASDDSMELNFLNYVSSLAFQAMIFLGQIPNPMADNKIDMNLSQAKLLIDTLVLIRDKTKGNLTKEEEDILNSSVYELQVQFVEQTRLESQRDIVP